MMKPIETEEEFNQALKRLGEIFGAPAGTPEGDEADKLADIIGAYDDEHYPITLSESAKVANAGIENT